MILFILFKNLGQVPYIKQLRGKVADFKIKLVKKMSHGDKAYEFFTSNSCYVKP